MIDGWKSGEEGTTSELEGRGEVQSKFNAKQATSALLSGLASINFRHGCEVAMVSASQRNFNASHSSESVLEQDS